MKKITICLHMIFLIVSFTNLVYASDLTYTLLLGSTITPFFGSTPIGETEPLTGTFTWYEINSGSTNMRVFDASFLYFRSPSYEITLNTTA